MKRRAVRCDFWNCGKEFTAPMHPQLPKYYCSEKCENEDAKYSPDRSEMKTISVYCDNTFCNYTRMFEVEETQKAPYYCPECKKNHDHAIAERLELLESLQSRHPVEDDEYDDELEGSCYSGKFSIIDDFKKLKESKGWSGVKPQGKRLSVKQMWNDLAKEFDVSDSGVLHHRYGLHMYNKDMAYVPDRGLREIAEEISPMCGRAGTTPVKFIRARGQVFRTRSLIDMLVGMSAQEGVAAWEAVQEDAFLAQENRKTHYVEDLKAATMTGLCHSDDELPF